jgi:hydroxyacylglutathione hydrolase
MHRSLSKVAVLPGDTLMYCGHEYTLANIAFAKWVEPENGDLLRREQDTQTLRQQDIPSLPSQLDLERRTNPFLRFDVPNVIHAAENFAKKSLKPGAETFGAVRFWKDSEFD